jgi:hypothetical protein
MPKQLQWQTVAIPDGWELRSGAPVVIDPQLALDAERVVGLTEDMFSFKRGRLVMDVGWMPDESPKGEYVCRVVKDDDWERPLEMYCTREPLNVVWFVTFAAQRY